jgi:hypothetical protein
MFRRSSLGLRVNGMLEVRDGSVVRGAGGAARRFVSIAKYEAMGPSGGVSGDDGGGELLLPVDVQLWLRRRVERGGRVASGFGDMTRVQGVRRLRTCVCSKMREPQRRHTDRVTQCRRKKSPYRWHVNVGP